MSVCGGHREVPGWGSSQRRWDLSQVLKVKRYTASRWWTKRETHPSAEGQPELQGWTVSLSTQQMYLLTPGLCYCSCHHWQWVVAASFAASNGRVRGCLQEVNHTYLSLITSSVASFSLQTPLFFLLKFLSNNNMITCLLIMKMTQAYCWHFKRYLKVRKKVSITVNPST